MRKKLILSTIFIFLVIGILMYPKKENQIINTEDENKNNMLSIMVEKEAGTGKYNDASSFPSTGYYLNKKLSKCVNGSKISFSDGNLYVKGNKSDRCYAYFDKDELGSICRGENMAECIIQNYKKDSTIIYHDGKADYPEEENYELEAGDLSYRYSGSYEEVNNYVCLDNKDNGECAAEDLYRIIGIFKNEEDKYEVKLIKAQGTTSTELGNSTLKGSAYSGNYDYDKSYYKGTNSDKLSIYYWNISNGYGKNAANTNMWQYSNLNKVNLNNYFYNYLINKASYLQNLITEHTWITAGNRSSGNAKSVYDSELGENKIKIGDNYCYMAANIDTVISCAKEDIEYEDYIGLMYISDYMYGTTPNNWKISMGNYKNDDVKDNNWLYIGMQEWTISRYAHNGSASYMLEMTGYIQASILYYNYSVRPSFYITSNAKLKEGGGAYENPYRLQFN